MKNPIFTKDDNGDYRIMTADEVTKATKQHLARRVRRGNTMTSPDIVRDYLIAHYGDKEHEIFGAIFLDNRHRIIEISELFTGTIDGCSVYPREVIKTALQLNAAACCLFHNHPSGVCEPSQADERITQRLKSAFELVDIRVIDHVLVAGSDSISFASRGLL